MITPWKQTMIVAGFTFKDAVRRRSFWITNFIYIALILAASLVLPRLGGGTGMEVTGFSEGVSVEEIAGSYNFSGAGLECWLLNESGDLPEAASLLEAWLLLDMRPVSPGGIDAALEAVREGKNAALVEITGSPRPHIRITTKDPFSMFPVEAVWQALNKAYQLSQFAALGYDARQSQEILAAALPLTTEMAAGQSVSNLVAGIALVLLMFMTIYIYGYGVAMSVATEKSTRVMETLIVSAKPSRILLGKCVGMGLVGLSQLGGVLLLSFASAKAFVPGGTFGGGFELPGLTAGKAALLVLYFLLGYALFSMINSMCGAMVNKMEDLQSAMAPATLISMFSFYGGYVLTALLPMLGGGSAGQLTLTGAMLIPFTAPFAAPGALLGDELSLPVLAASVGILLVTIAAVAVISGKVYAVSVLHYGGRLRFRDVRRMISGK